MFSFAAHKMLDYTAALCLAVLGLVVANVSPALKLFLGAAVVQTAYTLLTVGPFSRIRWLPPLAHLALDAAIGLALAAAPWALGYRPALTNGQLAVHLGAGLVYLSLAALTSRRKAPVWDTERVPLEDLKEAATGRR